MREKTDGWEIAQLLMDTDTDVARSQTAFVTLDDDP